MSIELTIARHCVPNDPDSGLSPAQSALLDTEERVRIVSAPTGAGKSYVFQHAVAKRDQRVLFIVPTRRLAQNLAQGLLEDLVKLGWDEAKAHAKVVVWSSDASEQLRARGVQDVVAFRVKEIKGLDITRAGGEMIIAVPETVSYILTKRWVKQGQSDAGIFDFMRQFDHIVFDEFHTIQPRGFGLAAVFAKLAALVRGEARVSFLSATPLDIQPVLTKLGIADTDVRLIKESVGDTGRAVHGDVRLCFEEAPTLADLAATHLPTLAAELERGRQVVLIYDALKELEKQKPILETLLQRLGLARDYLFIDSIDDSREGQANAGRDKNPLDYKVLIATASVEMGVTFKADVILMEPGIQPLNFLQRYGRAARGDHQGQVIVRYDQAMRDNLAWLRQLLKWAEKNVDTTISIAALTAQLCRAVEKRLRNQQLDSFGEMPSRAAYAAGVYWQLLMTHPSNDKHRREQLQHAQPNTSRHVYGWLQQVRQMAADPGLGKIASAWCDNFLNQAAVLRDIGPRVRVREGNGHTFIASENWLFRHTDILERGVWCYSKDEKDLDEVQIEETLQDSMREQSVYMPIHRTVYFPHLEDTRELEDNGELIKNWCALLEDRRIDDSDAWEKYPDAMAAAVRLVRASGLVVGDITRENTSGSGVL